MAKKYAFNVFTNEFDIISEEDVFKIIQPDSGTSPTADSSGDTLTITSSDGTIDVTGNSTTDTIDLTLGTLIAPSYTDISRPAFGTAGRIIFNTDDGQLNIDNGTAWTLPDGTVT